ncbi:Malectin/receptor-like protein kinase family protein [Theobroma cacao]|uniref:non-specific serine/threonine protein kinase n=1 Tax=Theobroma cacao TaxID=3641 RepID=A0A061F2X2_THECC|nr:Malectin/receptor-like protein kinase family protein [Theobroma cacao]
MATRNYFVFSIVWFSLIFSVIHVSSQPLAVDCGSKGGKDEDGRTWEPDTKYLLPSNSSVQLQAGYQDPSLLSTVPYMNARIFTSPATYQFPIKMKERYLVRFHFYPSAYLNFNISNSYISVVAAGVTLMNNFSAAITCQALTQAYLVKEYSLAPMDTKVLNITFTPSTNYTNSFAFINGIELIAMPNLFGMTNLVGYGSSSVDVSTENLQMMFRLNVGGQSISPSKDAGGLLRSWYNDDPYLFGAAMGVNLEASKNLRVDYKDLPKSSAPEDIYRTARAMGRDSQLNLKFNLTWLFQVDANFTYIVRLHFCEFQLDKVNQRVFNVYINNQSAQADPTPADIIAWTNGKGVPIYKDYAIVVSDGPGDEMVRIDITPSTASKPEYYDSQLNGVEIFKLNDGSKNLGGSNPQPSAMLLQAESEPKKSFKSNNVVIGGATGGAAAAFVVVALIVVYTKKKRVHGVESHTSSWLPLYGNSHTTGSKSHGKSHSSHLSTLAQGLSRHFSISEIKQATKNFDESNVIGVGGFGKVYKGAIDGGTKVAIKRSNPSSEQGINEFQTEIEMLSKLRHKHLVSLIGFCEDGGEMCLVYDYMARGTFREHIYNNKKSHLSWKQRLEICIGAARGLHYLHTGAKYTIIHRDVKTTNILLDENWVAKVSDFGLSKTGPDMNQGHVSTVVKGSFGYLDPEYFRRQQLTEKSDVYSFGVVLFEALCARPALNPSLPKEQVSLADWALHCQKKGVLEDIIDPHLKGKIDPECLKKFADTAEKCLSDHGLERPHMGDVLWNLEFALQLQETADGSKGGGSSSTGDQGSVRSTDSSVRSQRQGVHVGNLSLGSEHEVNEEVNNESAIFSQLVNPKGR